MRRTIALFALAFASLAAAVVAAFLRPAPVKPAPPPATAAAAAGGMRLSAILDRLYYQDDRATTAWLEVDLAAASAPSTTPRVPVNAVLILDRSGSMSGPKIARARDAANALVRALGPEDRLAIVEFSSTASVLVESTAVTPASRARALAAIETIEPMGGTNMSAAFEAAVSQLQRGSAAGRVDKIFLASDGRANEGVSERGALLRLAQSLFSSQAQRTRAASATLSTFGIGNDYDEDLMSALAAQAGGRARYIDSPDVLPAAFAAELSRASALVARDVRVRVGGLSGAAVQGVLGFEPVAGWVRLPDFAAGEERRVIVKLSVPPGRGLLDLASVELAFQGADGEPRSARTTARATFTADASLLARPPTPAALAAAQAEMAQLAGEAARLQERGDIPAARHRLAEIGAVAGRAALAMPAREPEMQRAAKVYQVSVGQIRDEGSAESKKLKQQVFDAFNAPVAGW